MDPNVEFYRRYPYPAQPTGYCRPVDPDFWPPFYSEAAHGGTLQFPDKPRIWVAGCGTHQALDVALQFPKASVLGTDLSDVSVAMCRRDAEDIGVQNLTLRVEDIMDAQYRDEFDLVFCTGVLHHMMQLEDGFANIELALNRNGIAEVMVYNRFHIGQQLAFAEAIETLGGDPLGMAEYVLHRKLGVEEADTLVHPSKFGYTVRSLTASTTMLLLQPARPGWWIDGLSPTVQHRLGELYDTARWEVIQLLKYDQSPFLWFYFQRPDARRARAPECVLNEQFRQDAGKFEPANTALNTWKRNIEGRIVPDAGVAEFPPRKPGDPLRINFEPSPELYNYSACRMMLASPYRPYFRRK